MNDSPTGTVRIGQVIVDSGQAFTLEGLEVGGLTVKAGAKATMLQSRTEIYGSIGLAGVFTMENGFIDNAKTVVQRNAELVINAGKIGSRTTIEVKTGGKLTIKKGVVIEAGTSVYWNGVLLDNTTNPRGLPASPLSLFCCLSSPHLSRARRYAALPSWHYR